MFLSTIYIYSCLVLLRFSDLHMLLQVFMCALSFHIYIKKIHINEIKLVFSIIDLF